MEPEDVDDGYFTPVASTTLASIFKDDSSNDAAVNPSLKYKPPKLKKIEETSRPGDAGASQCVFSCSVIAYEWVQGSHTCKGKAGFAIMRTVKSGLCKIILYSCDKPTLSCTSLLPLLEVTVKGAMISLYDDHNKYWRLCFNNKTIEQVKDILKYENVFIKHVNPEIELFDSDETDNSSLAKDGAATPRNTKESILNRMANLGHAILPSLPGSQGKKITPLDITNSLNIFDSLAELKVLPGSSVKKNHDITTMQDQEPAKSIAIQTCNTNVEGNNMLTNNLTGSAQTSVTSLPLINNQIFTYVNGYMVPLHMQMPVLDNVINADTCAEIELMIHKLTKFKDVVRSIESKHLQSKEEIHPCRCKDQEQKIKRFKRT